MTFLHYLYWYWHFNFQFHFFLLPLLQQQQNRLPVEWCRKFCYSDIGFTQCLKNFKSIANNDRYCFVYLYQFIKLIPKTNFQLWILFIFLTHRHCIRPVPLTKGHFASFFFFFFLLCVSKWKKTVFILQYNYFYIWNIPKYAPTLMKSFCFL